MKEVYVISSKEKYKDYNGDEKWKLPRPEPLPCEFCGAPRYFLGKGFQAEDGTITKIYWPERKEELALPCSCPEGLQRYRGGYVMRRHSHLAPKRSEALQEAQELQKHTQFRTLLQSNKEIKVKTVPDNKNAIASFESFFFHYEYLYLLPASCNIHRGLYVYGNPGTGKTLMSSYLCRSLQKEGIPALLISGAELLQFIMEDVKDTWSNKNTQAIAKTVEVLIIDDMDKIAPSSWAINMLFDIINARNSANLSTIFTNNHSLEQLGKYLNKNPKADKETVAALIDRISGMTYPVYLGGKSWR